MNQTASPTAKAGQSSQNVFVGRQPIFDRNGKVYAYELLFRSGDEAAANVRDGDQATSQVIVNTFMELGLDTIVGPHRAFINLTDAFLNGQLVFPFPKDRMVLEILENVKVDAALVQNVSELARQGYTIALDDFIYSEQWQPLVESAGIIKIDVLALDRAAIQQHVDLLRPHGVKLLAEKVETQDDYQVLQEMGFDYFQGYFLSRPKIVQGRRLPDDGIRTMQLLAALNAPEADLSEVSETVAQDVSLSYKLMRYLNSAWFGLPNKLESPRQAAVYLGLQGMRSWATLLAMAGMSDKPSEMMHMSLVRARMCEQLAELRQADRPGAWFTTGLLSTLDIFMDAPMDEILEQLPLAEDISQALIAGKGPLGQALRCAKAAETMDLEALQGLNIPAADISRIYLESVAWAFETGAALG